MSRIDSASVRLHVDRAQALAASDHLRSATETYFDLFESGFRHPLILTNLGSSLFREGRVPEAIIAYRSAISRNSYCAPAWSNLLLALNCLDKISPADIAAEHRRFGELFAAPPQISGPRRPGRLRLGFLSASFFRHSGTSFFEPVLRTLDRRTFQIFCYQANQYEDTVTQRMVPLADKWRVIASSTDAEASDQIRADHLDLLIDLDGHTGLNRLPILAKKPARVQLTWLGYPNTTGLPSIDYRLTDSISDPVTFTDKLHTEKLLRLDPPFLVFSPPGHSPPVAPTPQARNGYVTFGIFNQIHKLSDSVVAAASRVLDRVQSSRLLLKATAFADPEVCNATAERLEACGVDRSRIAFAGPIHDSRLHLEAHHQVDIMLDSFPYAGTTTTCEALWMGVPVVTLEGQTHHARVGSSLLQSIGLAYLIGRSVDEYVAIASSLASNPALLTSLRSRMRQRMLASPLMDLHGFVQRFQNALLYSARSVDAGSTFAARHAGTPHASTDINPSSTITPP